MLHSVSAETKASELLTTPTGNLNPTFDGVAQKTPGQEQRNRGPLVVELPLTFHRTPTSYRVDIAR